MKTIEMIEPGEFLWVMDENGSLKMIQVEDIYWDKDPDLYGWNVVCGDREYWLECCFELSSPMMAN